MGQSRGIWSLTVRIIAVIAGVVFLLGSITTITRLGSNLVAPVLGPERVEMTEVGFAISLPRDWEHQAATVDDADWWDPAHGTPTAQHEWFLERGGLLLSRSTGWTLTGHEECRVYRWSARDAQDYVNAVDDEPNMTTIETDRLDLPGGDAVIHDILMDDGRRWRDYIVTDGDRWLLLECGSMTPPEERWRSIADTIEFLPDLS